MKELYKNAPEDPVKRQIFMEKVVSRLARRAKRTATALITPFPISNTAFNVDVNGTILRYMFPCKGLITKGFLRLVARPKKEVYLHVKVFNDTLAEEKTYTISKKLTDSDFNLNVIPGDCLEVSLINKDKENPINEVWISFLWEPTVSSAVTKQFLIDTLEDNTEIADQLTETTSVTEK